MDGKILKGISRHSGMVKGVSFLYVRQFPNKIPALRVDLYIEL